MLVIKGEARAVLSENRTWDGKTWIDYSLNLELQDGKNQLVFLGKEMATEENIQKLKTLKGKNVEIDVRIYHKGDFLKLYLVNMPVFK